MNMAPSTKPKYSPTSKSRPCKICGNISGYCKTRIGDRGDLLHYCHNHTAKPSGPIAGHYFTSASDEWGVFSTEKPRNQGPENTRAKNTKRLPQPLPTTADRAAAFRAFMGSLTLHPDDRADLNLRGVSDAQIEAWGVLSIESTEPGYLCPCYSPDGSIVGAQWRLRDAGEGARYKWVWWLGGGSKNGEELPLTVHRPIGVAPSGIAVCEGIGAKSFILAQNTGMVTIGAGVAGQFVSSPDHWREYLAELTSELNINNLIFYPDAGSVRNASVMGHYSQWFAFVADLGYTIDVAWWGQSVKGESPDPDELTADVEVKFISVEEFEAIAKPVEEIPWECLPEHLDQIGSWKFIDVPIDAVDLIGINRDRARQNPNYEYVGPCTIKKEAVERFREFEPQLPLSFKITKIVESPDGGWLELEVVQRRGKKRIFRTVLIRSIFTTKIDAFIDALKAALGYNVPCTLKPNALQALIQNRSAQYHLAGGRFYKLAPRTGRQDDGYWVFKDIQFDPKGNVCTSEESRWLFNRNLGIDEHIVSPSIAPPSPNALLNLITAAKGYFHAESFPMALMTLGYGVATVHRDQIMKEHNSFPQINVFGDPGGGKTLAATMACSLFSLHHSAIGSFTKSMLWENVKSLGSLLRLLDDPLKKEKRDGPLLTEMVNFLWAMYDGEPRMVRGNLQTPYSNVIVTSNQAIESCC